MTTDWTMWSAIGQLAAAVATVAAVIASLYIANQGTKSRLKVTTGVRLIIIPGQTAPYPEIISIDVRNTGIRDVHVDQIGWRAGKWPFAYPSWLSRSFAVQQFDTVPESQNPPFHLPPGRRATAMLRLDQSIENIMARSGDEPLFAKKWPFRGISRTPIFVTVFLASGEVIHARVEKGLEDKFLAGEIAKFENAIAQQPPS